MTTVLVVCRECEGACEAPDGTACGWCMAQGHIAVDRLPDGSLPDGCREWIAPTLPVTPENPLVLTYPSHHRCC